MAACHEVRVSCLSRPAVYLFIRVQQPVMPWWKGESCCCSKLLDLLGEKKGSDAGVAPCPQMPLCLPVSRQISAHGTPSAPSLTCNAHPAPSHAPPGDKASVCISDKQGDCRPQTPPIPPPVKEEKCSANVCFMLDGSKSLVRN